jgi:hypothetical protein
MNEALCPAKRHRKERIRAAMQHSTGIKAVGRIVYVLVWCRGKWSLKHYSALMTAVNGVVICTM